MIPRIVCRSCSSELASSDKFCSSCGGPIEWGDLNSSPPSSQPKPLESPGEPGAVPCQLCGHLNAKNSVSCESCGNELARPGNVTANQTVKETRVKGNAPTPVPNGFFQSWKFIAILAIVLILIVAGLKIAYDKSGPRTEPPPKVAEIAKEIDELQRLVEKEPRNERATLRLANRLHDVRDFPSAIEMYERYLEMNPSNPDARVDLGTSYFELSLIDSSRHEEYIQAAKREIQKALTFAPKHQLAYFNLGIVSLQDGQLKEANDWFKKCIEIDPASEAAQRAKQLLNQHSSIKPS